MENSKSRGGRPAIGPPVTLTLPAGVITAVDRMAMSVGVTRSAMLRQIVEDATQSTRTPANATRSEDLAPATLTLAEWIALDADPESVRERFIAYRKVAGTGKGVADVLARAAGELLLAGRQFPAPDMPLVARLTASAGWRIRAALMLEVINELAQRGISPRADSGDDERIRFDPPEEDYA